MDDDDDDDDDDLCIELCVSNALQNMYMYVCMKLRLLKSRNVCVHEASLRYAKVDEASLRCGKVHEASLRYDMRLRLGMKLRLGAVFGFNSSVSVQKFGHDTTRHD